MTLFGDNSEENAKRIKYCKWKAVTIAKESKAGGGTSGRSGGTSANNSGVGNTSSGEGPNSQEGGSTSAGNGGGDYITSSNKYFDDQSTGVSGGSGDYDHQASVSAAQEDDADIDFGLSFLSFYNFFD